VAGQPIPHDAGLQVSINTQAITLPIVDATDNRFLRLSTSEGVSQTKVDYIVQDNDGFMWFGTRFGLYRYDGYAFKIFVRNEGNPNSLDGVVRALFKDRDGALWVACDQSLDKFDRTTETFTRYPIPLVTHITQDAAGLLWLTSNRGLYGLDPSSRRIWHYSHDPADPLSLSSNDPAYCGEDKTGAFWVASNGRLDEFDRKAGKVRRHIVIPDAPTGFQFYEDHSGVFWIFHASPNALAVEKYSWDQLDDFYKHGLAYAQEMSNRPQTLYCIADSPVGLAAWMIDHDIHSYLMIARVFEGKAEGLTREDILDNITLYWLTNAAISSARLYWDTTQISTGGGFFDVRGVKLHVAVSAFPDEIYQAPKSWAEKAYPKLIYYSRLPKVGHFAAWEQPQLFAEELRAAFRSLR
jgi:hypothetical protein